MIPEIQALNEQLKKACEEIDMKDTELKTMFLDLVGTIMSMDFSNGADIPKRDEAIVQFNNVNNRVNSKRNLQGDTWLTVLMAALKTDLDFMTSR